MTKPTVSNIKASQTLRAGYRRRELLLDENEFLGFKYNGTLYADLGQLKAAFGVKNLREVEFESDRFDGGSVTAEFRNVEGEYLWGAYLWNGGFRVGTSADRLVLAA